MSVDEFGVGALTRDVVGSVWVWERFCLNGDVDRRKCMFDVGESDSIDKTAIRCGRW